MWSEYDVFNSWNCWIAQCWGNQPFLTPSPKQGLKQQTIPLRLLTLMLVVEVPDKRLQKITELVKPKKTVPTTFEFTDIAGIVKGASKGEGLGNKFLSNIRQVDAICHVVRCFDDENITHVSGRVYPLYRRHRRLLTLELILSGSWKAVDKRL